MIETLLGIVLVVLTFGLNYLFVTFFVADVRHRDNALYYLSVIIAQIIFSIVLRELIIVKFVVNYLLFVLSGVVIFSLSTKRSLIVNAFFLGLFSVGEGLTYGAYQMFFGVKKFDELLNITGAFFIEICSMLILLMVILLIGILNRKSFVFSQMDIKGWIVFILFPLFSLVSVSMFVINYSESIYERMKNVYFAICGCLLVLNMLLFYLLNNVVRRERELQEKRALISQAELISRMYESLAADRERQKAKSHDYLNHLNVMLALLKSGNVEESVKYISNQMNDERTVIDVFDTGNLIINSVLNIKYYEAINKGIIFSIIIDSLSDIKISDSDLVTILSNLLDNAIEATEKCMDKRIILKIRKDNNQLYIFESNTYDGQVNSVGKTTKKDIINHGYGIANIQRTVHQNNGDYITRIDEKMYCVTIVFPL